MLGIVTPVYFWQLPLVTRNFLNRLSLTGENSSPYTFIIVTYGTTPGCTAEDARRILDHKKIRLSSAFSVRMPDTWTPFFDLSDHDHVKRLNACAEKEIDQVIASIQARVTGNHMARRLPYAFRIMTDKAYNKARRTVYFHVEDSCVGCHLCEKNCPVQAIAIKDGKPVWFKEQCALCLRCLHFCPKFAIQYGNGSTKKHGQYHYPGIG